MKRTKKFSSCKHNEILTEQLDASVPFLAVVVIPIAGGTVENRRMGGRVLRKRKGERVLVKNLLFRFSFFFQLIKKKKVDVDIATSTDKS
jgi:hypothetical protein